MENRTIVCGKLKSVYNSFLCDNRLLWS